MFYGELAIFVLSALATVQAGSMNGTSQELYRSFAGDGTPHFVNLDRRACPSTNGRRELPELLQSKAPLPFRGQGRTEGKKVLEKRDTNRDGTTFLWSLKNTYQGETFFDDKNWHFYTGDDPTHGTVNYVDRDTAIRENLVSVNDQGHAIIQGDNNTWLPYGEHRKSVRVISKDVYHHGLFIFDLNKAPWGCGIWPAFWTLGTGSSWPDAGEIDIIEGVHNNEVNQVAWHTKAGCYMTQKPQAKFTGEIHKNPDGTDNLVCDGCVNHNSGCAIVQWDRASYGPYFDSQGGGVFVAKWDENGISIWNFYRSAIPPDITSGSPSPDSWGEPSAHLAPDNCDMDTFFYNHTIIINITFCGDWAGNSYATAPNCPGTCAERMMDPTNFVNATWDINSLKVYSKQSFIGSQSRAERTATLLGVWGMMGILAAVGGALLL